MWLHARYRAYPVLLLRLRVANWLVLLALFILSLVKYLATGHHISRYGIYLATFKTLLTFSFNIWCPSFLASFIFLIHRHYTWWAAARKELKPLTGMNQAGVVEPKWWQPTTGSLFLLHDLRLHVVSPFFLQAEPNIVLISVCFQLSKLLFVHELVFWSVLFESGQGWTCDLWHVVYGLIRVL